jgi:hypothetical protein
MKEAIGYHRHRHQQQQQQQQQQEEQQDENEDPSPFALPAGLSLSNDAVGCLKGPIVRCMQVAEFVHVSQVNACALALTCLFKPRQPSDLDSALLPPPPSLSSTAAVFHRFGIPGNATTSRLDAWDSHADTSFSSLRWQGARVYVRYIFPRFYAGVHGCTVSS